MNRRISVLLIASILLFAFSYPAFAAGEDDFWAACQQNDYAKAGELAKELGRIIPEYYSLAAICYQNINNYEEFAIYKNKFQQLGNPAVLKELLFNQQNISQDNPQVLYMEGIVAIIFPEVRVGGAKSFLERAAVKLKDNPYLNNYLAMNELNNLNYSITVQKYLQKAISLKKDFPEPYINLAVLLAQNKETEKAISVLLDCFNNCPSVPTSAYECLINLTSATVSITIKPYGEPMLVSVPSPKEQYRQKIKAALRKTPIHLLGLAELYIIKGNGITTRDLLEGVDFGNSSLASYLQLQIAHLDGDFQQVTENANALLTSNDLNYHRIFEVGNILFYGKDFKLAIAFYQAALGLINPDDSEYLQKTYTNLGTCFYLNQDYQNAIVNLDKALTYNQQDPSSLVYLGLTYRDLGDNTKAIEDLTKALDNIHDPEWRQEITGIINELKQPETLSN